MATTELKTVASTLHTETAKFLRELAQKADRGEVIAVTVVAELPTGNYEISGTRTLSRLQTIGALFDAALDRANQ